MNQPRQQRMIELGGGYASTSNLNYTQTHVKHPSRPNLPLPSRQVIESTHRISQKMSPTKMLTHSRSKKGSIVGENDQSFTDLNSSKISQTSNRKGERAYLVDRSNKPSPQRQLIKMTYPNRNSSTSSRQESLKTQQMAPSPVRTSAPLQMVSREIELQRKLKIIQGRVGQLHRQKQEVVMKLNEQNRKVYHENTTLKLKVNDLTKMLQRNQVMRQSTKYQKVQKDKDFSEKQVLQSAHIEINNLKEEINQLENYISEGVMKITTVTDEKNELESQVDSLNSIINNQKQLLSQLTEKNNSQEIELANSQQKIAQLESYLNEWKLQKDNNEMEIESLNKKIEENKEIHVQSLNKFQQKIKEYENAYNENQALINELEDQIKSLQCQQVSKDLEESNIEAKTHEQLESQCLELEKIFTRSIQERDGEIDRIMKENQHMSQQLRKLDSQIQNLVCCDEEKTFKLKEASMLLQKVTERCQQISSKYDELVQKYDVEMSKTNKTEGFKAKCKKCDDLLKTVLRLNNQLNIKR